MDTNQFNALKIEERLKIVNKKITELKKEKKSIVKSFPNEEFDFSYSFIQKNLKKEGYFLNKENGIFEEGDGSKLNKLRLEDEEILFLKQFIDNQKSVLDVNKDRIAGSKSFRAYDDDYENFKAYCKNNKLRVQDALSVALNDFMNK